MSTRMRVRRWLFRIAVVAALGSAALYVAAFEAMGDRPQGARLERMKASPQHNGDAFDNPLARVDGPYDEMLSQWIFGGSTHRMPTEPIAFEKRARADYDTPPVTGLRVTWLGHSTMLLEIDGRRVLIDPVWGERSSPLPFMGPKRYYAPPLALDELPKIDAILISHDHYDHLDHSTVELLADQDVQWFVPLGIGAHLEYWGVDSAKVREFDWWDSAKIGDLDVTCTPARHFSGRGLTDANRTLWSGWAIRGPDHNVYYSGDTSMFPGFIEIGEKLGPFDLTMIEVGAYDALWADVHLGPEQGVRAHRLVKGRTMLPVHWGLFDLALHGWTEPIERVRAAAEQEGVVVLMPKPGGRVEPTIAQDFESWWPDVPWVDAQAAPCRSSGVDVLNSAEHAPPERCSDAARTSLGGTQFVAEDKTKIWYRVAGQEGAPVVVYLHGGPGSSSLTFEQSAGALLEKTFRVLYLDQRGAGRSGFEGPPAKFGMVPTIADIEALRVEIGAERISLIGHSFGGVVAAAYALEHPDRIDGIVMVDTTPFVGDALAHQVAYISRPDTFPGHAQALAAIARAEGTPFERLGQSYERLGRLELQAKLHFARPHEQGRMELIERLAKRALCTSPDVVDQFVKEGFLGSKTSVARPLPGRILHIAGAASEVIGRPNIERAAEAWGGSIEWLRAGHFVYFEAPTEFAEHVTRFLFR